MKTTCKSICLWATFWLLPFCATAQTDTLFQAHPSFGLSTRTVSTSVFHWYVPTGGQLSGPWVPLEGRENWTGEVDWWKDQIKQIMAANIDILNVHLMKQIEFVRVNLFQALYELRSEGYNVPKVAPFLDPLITWYNLPNIDLATAEGKDSLAAQYIRFYQQYFSQNTDPYASDYLARIEGKPVLDTWHVFLNMDNVSALSRSDLETRLNAVFGANYPTFNNGIYMVTTALNNPVFSFADERVPQFEINQYYYPYLHNGINAVQLKGGYWDQNVRNPGDFLPRAGGAHYIDAWGMIDSTIDRIYIESWNEYDEGTGIYATDTVAPFIKPGSGNVNTDLWSLTNDPYEYIRTTYAGAAAFNGQEALDAHFLRHTFPPKMNPQQTLNVIVRLRNEGNALWSAAGNYTLQQLPSDPLQFAQSAATIDDTQHDIPTYNGIFRGRPLDFTVSLQAPDTNGTYLTHWQMFRNDTAFGEVLAVDIRVTGFPLALDPGERSRSFELAQNVPNPFSEATTIRFQVVEAQSLRLKLYDLRGVALAVVGEGFYAPGEHQIEWKAGSLANGLYYLRLESDQGSQTIKMVLQR